jgi:transcriptional repressor of cell division inhibition gene dicB
MQKSLAIEHFGGITKLAAKLGISRQAIHAWPEEVPDLWQYKIHHLSEGKVPIEPPRAESRPQ